LRGAPDTIVGFGDTRLHAEAATFELRASEVANPRAGDQLTVSGETFVVQGSPSGGIQTGLCGQSMCGRRKRRRSGGPLSPLQNKPDDGCHDADPEENPVHGSPA
jgi:hypothetical protein